MLVSGATRTVRDYPQVGTLLEPSHRSDPAALPLERPWAVDNGAFSGFDEAAFQKLLRRFRPHRSGQCKFVAAPDVVGDAAATTARFRTWEPRLHAEGWPVAYVGQDGLQLADVPWASCEAVFIGGTTAWKLGPSARALVEAGVARGKWVHMGRVNRNRRIRYALRLGCDSIDGTSFSRWALVHIPRALHTMRAFQGGPLLEGLEA